LKLQRALQTRHIQRQNTLCSYSLLLHCLHPLCCSLRTGLETFSTAKSPAEQTHTTTALDCSASSAPVASSPLLAPQPALGFSRQRVQQGLAACQNAKPCARPERSRTVAEESAGTAPLASHLWRELLRVTSRLWHQVSRLRSSRGV
jgi:hypothetical protein